MQHLSPFLKFVAKLLVFISHTYNKCIGGVKMLLCNKYLHKRNENTSQKLINDTKNICYCAFHVS